MADRPRGDEDRRERTAARRPVALWKLLVAVAGLVVVIDVAEDAAPGWSIAVFVLLFVALDVACLRWARDSRDGLDWKPNRRRRPSPDGDGEDPIGGTRPWMPSAKRTRSFL